MILKKASLSKNKFILYTSDMGCVWNELLVHCILSSVYYMMHTNFPLQNKDTHYSKDTDWEKKSIYKYQDT